MSKESETLCRRLAYRFRDPALLTRALTHRSKDIEHNERLEFLGDSVLNLMLSERLYREFPAASEGDLSRLRARLVSEEPLAEIAQEMQLGELLLLGSGELKTGGHRRQSILADAFEALCGALYLDGGLEQVRARIGPRFESRIAALPEPSTLKDAKTRLQEFLQSRGHSLPTYMVKRTTGEPHAQTFSVRCVVQLAGETRSIEAAGSGSSRRRAEQQAAAGVLTELAARWPA